MSGMSDPTQMPGQPSQEEMRAYLEQLRQADPAGLIAESFNLLATGAQVKLGRSDARVLIDALGAIVQAAQPSLPAELTEQMSQGVAQLKMAQVQAERDLASQEAAGEQPASDGQAQAEGASGADAAEPRTSSPQPGGTAADKRMTDRLWVPGRGPRPPGV